MKFEKDGKLYTFKSVPVERWSKSKRSYYWGSEKMLVCDSTGQYQYSSNSHLTIKTLKNDGYTRLK